MGDREFKAPEFKLPVLQDQEFKFEDLSDQVPDISQVIEQDEAVRARIPGPCGPGCCKDRWVTMKRSEAVAKGYRIE